MSGTRNVSRLGRIMADRSNHSPRTQAMISAFNEIEKIVADRELDDVTDVDRKEIDKVKQGFNNAFPKESKNEYNKEPKLLSSVLSVPSSQTPVNQKHHTSSDADTDNNANSALDRPPAKSDTWTVINEADAALDWDWNLDPSNRPNVQLSKLDRIKAWNAESKVWETKYPFKPHLKNFMDECPDKPCK